MSKLSDALKKIIGVVAPIAPTIATALGGPGAGAAVSVLSRVLLGREGGTEDEVAAALATASPDALLKLKAEDHAFALEAERIAAEDRDSARKMRIATGDWIPGALALFITFGFFGVLSYLLRHGVPAQGGDAMLVMLGALGTAWGAVVNFYFGSSASSRSKDAALAHAATR